jgi:asparagine synthase (glutamine-hydrolysing)
MPDSGPCCVLLSGGLDSSVLTGLAVLHAREQGRTVRTFTLDFAEQDKYYKPELDPARPDPPFAHDVVKHLGTEHTDLVLDDAALADPAVRQACVEARDLPVAAVRDHSRVTLNGDGAQAFGPSPGGGGRAERGPSPEGPRRVPLSDDALVDASFLAKIGRDDYSRQRTAEAMAEIPALDGESDTDRRIRAHHYLSLTRVASWATSERRDRLSAAAGAEIRTPYYDHRLTQYLFNTPWPLKSFDGMDRSLLRAVAGDLVPVSVKERKKKGYPGILHLRYTATLQRQVQDLINSNHSALEFYDRQQLAAAVGEAPGSVSRAQKFGMERLLDLAIWMDSRRPVFRLP